ncbi:hypothetical protein B0T16DRAFT_201936 [Cercophora newfieldiana]|uniref:Secreted protein n=1 Tax=Cercophora newfieldiana TaxID=92897 RepID=A0AA39XV05_9PEZI|nr:hypothetical protein B0T16DRAFT_201936 [Cercophora newfieldiana]
MIWCKTLTSWFLGTLPASAASPHGVSPLIQGFSTIMQRFEEMPFFKPWDSHQSCSIPALFLLALFFLAYLSTGHRSPFGGCRIDRWRRRLRPFRNGII